MWILTIVLGVLLMAFGMARSYYRLLALLLVVALGGGVALAMLGGPVS